MTSKLDSSSFLSDHTVIPKRSPLDLDNNQDKRGGRLYRLEIGDFSLTIPRLKKYFPLPP